MKKRPGRRRTFKKRDQQLEDIHVLSCRGFSQSQIARQVGLSQPQISRDLEEIDKIICPHDATERARRRARLLSKMRHAEKELWDAWERSKQDKETSTKEKVLLAGNASGHAGKGGKTAKNANERNKASIKSEGRLPNSNYMGQLNKLWDREAKLLGMNEPETHDILVKQVQFIEIVRPAPKQPTPPTLTTLTTSHSLSPYSPYSPGSGDGRRRPLEDIRSWTEYAVGGRRGVSSELPGGSVDRAESGNG